MCHGLLLTIAMREYICLVWSPPKLVFIFYCSHWELIIQWVKGVFLLMFSFTGRRTLSLKTHCTPPLRSCELSSSFKDAEKEVSGISQFSCSIMSDSLWSHGLQQVSLISPPLSPGVCSNSCPLSQWCHPTILSSVVPSSFSLQSFPALESFPVSQLFTSSGQSIDASASAIILLIFRVDFF